MNTPGDVTQILARMNEGDEDAVHELLPMVYQELRTLARRFLGGREAGHTLSSTALVHEACLKLLGKSHHNIENRIHFFNVAARGMRQVLVDHARKHKRQKRGGGWKRRGITVMENLPAPLGLDPDDIVALDEALTEFTNVDERAARTVELRYFGGLTREEAAEVLGVTTRTVERDSSFALTWLNRELSRGA